MEQLKIKDKSIKYNEYLTQAELSHFPLSLKDRMLMFILGYMRIGTFQPSGFTAPVNFYLVKSKNGYFVSYPQGWEKVFYAPEAAR